MIALPNSKINIGLRVLDQRTDGYHNIETIFYPIQLCDVLEFTEADGDVHSDYLTVTGLQVNSDVDNLVLKAIRIFREERHIPYLKVHLHKIIPMGAGLGGGSSDASHMLNMLNTFYGSSLSDEQLEELSLKIGSDCPFFIKNIPSIAYGRGEILKSIPEILKGKYIVLANPGINVSTREAYRHYTPHDTTVSLETLVSQPIETWKNVIFNDFEEYVFDTYPQVSLLKQMFYEHGALYSSMTGSGSSVYGIFEEEPSIPDELTRMVIYKGLM